MLERFEASDAAQARMEEELATTKRDLAASNTSFSATKKDLIDMTKRMNVLTKMSNCVGRRDLLDMVRVSLNGGRRPTDLQKRSWNEDKKNLTDVQRTREGIMVTIDDLALTDYGGQMQEAGNEMVHDVDVSVVADAVMASSMRDRRRLENLFRFAFPGDNASDVFSNEDVAQMATVRQEARRAAEGVANTCNVHQYGGQRLCAYGYME